MRLRTNWRNEEQPCINQKKTVTYETTCQMIKSNLHEKWMNSWAKGTTGRPMYAHMNKPKHKDPIKKLKREDQTIIFRLRTRHVPLNNHLKRINVKNTATCPLCGYLDETVEHHLFDCVALKELRAEGALSSTKR